MDPKDAIALLQVLSQTLATAIPIVQSAVHVATDDDEATIRAELAKIQALSDPTFERVQDKLKAAAERE